MSRFEVIADEGLIASEPERVLSALVRMAEADGADSDEWLAKALQSAGAIGRHVAVQHDPRYKIVAQATKRAVEIYRQAMEQAHAAVLRRLEEAAKDPAARKRFKELLGRE